MRWRFICHWIELKLPNYKYLPPKKYRNLAISFHYFGVRPVSSTVMPNIKEIRHTLLEPTLLEVATVLEKSLLENFEKFSVEVVQCPDLTQPPFCLASPGLCGRPSLADVGGVAFMIPEACKDKIYRFHDLVRIAGLKEGLVIGAGAGNCHRVGKNSELMANIHVSENNSNNFNNTHICTVNPEDGSFCLEKVQHEDFCILGNLLICEGKPGRVLHVQCSKRTSNENFVSCLRKALSQHYGERSVGLGGVFIIKKGKANIHVMPDFSSTPLLSQEAIDNWLKFYTMSSVLTCLSVIVSYDPGLDLRLEHTHCFSDHGEGGHYHYDVTPDDVEYEGYFVVAQSLYRIDKPESVQTLGKYDE